MNNLQIVTAVLGGIIGARAINRLRNLRARR
jgi:hypothetical protein